MSITRLLAAMNLLRTISTLAWSTRAPISSALVPMDAPSPPAKLVCPSFQISFPPLPAPGFAVLHSVILHVAPALAFVRLHVGVGLCHVIHHFVRVVSLASSNITYTQIECNRPKINLHIDARIPYILFL